MLLLKDFSTSQEPPHVNMERSDRWHLCECGESGLPFPRGLPIVARLLVCPFLPKLGVMGRRFNDAHLLGYFT